jgi:hypothetical protein
VHDFSCASFRKVSPEAVAMGVFPSRIFQDCARL